VADGINSREIWTATIDGGHLTKLGRGKTPHFSADGTALYWIGRAGSDNDSLMRVDIDARGVPTGKPAMVQSFSGNFAGGFSMARDGTTVVWLYQASTNLWTVEVPAAKARLTAATPLTFDDVRNSYPVHSTDGRIAFHQIATGQPATTWIIGEDGKNRELLTAGLNIDVWAPQWTPDNKRLFVSTDSHEGNPGLAWLDVATRQLWEIGPANGAQNVRLSPDGKQIAFHVIDEGGVLNLWTQPVDGGPRTQITFDAEAMSYPTWSPDGTTLAVEIKRGDDTQIGVVPKDGGPVELLVTSPGQSWPHSWAPDNDRIAFAGARDGVWNIYTVSRTTKEVRQLTDFTSVEGYVRYPSWSRSRPSMVVVRGEQRGSLWTVKLP